MALELEAMCKSSTSSPFLLNMPSSWAIQNPLCVPAVADQLSRTFNCAQEGEDEAAEAKKISKRQVQSFMVLELAYLGLIRAARQWNKPAEMD
jgi:hypothetical protein